MLLLCSLFPCSSLLKGPEASMEDAMLHRNEGKQQAGEKAGIKSETSTC